jgi:hypothetical protein
MNTRTISRLAIAALLPLSLLGCRAGYDVEVRNLTDQPVTARLQSMHADGTPRSLATRRAGPGDRATMFTQVGGTERIALEVDFAGNIAYPATIDLSRGKTIVNVRRSDEGPRGRITLEEIARP